MEASAASLRHFMTSISTQVLHQNKPMKVAMLPQKLQPYWASINANIEAHLKQVIQVRPPFSVYEPMHHLVFSTPTTMAPELSIAACELVGGLPEKAIPAASALRLMNAASVVHQRLLLSGQSGDPDHHHSFPAGVELLTGDGILSFGYELLATASDKPERILKVISEITHAMGAQGLVKGQYMQMRCSGSALDGDEIGWAIEKKEGLLYACGAACGAILGGATNEETEKLRRFGRYVGMIHGMMTLTVVGDDDGGEEGEDEVRPSETVEELRSLALKELECFNHQPLVDTISSILHS